MRRREEPTGADVARVEEVAEENANLREQHARVGPATRELDLRALLQQHKSAYTAFLGLFQNMARIAEERGELAVHGWAKTHLLAEVYALGRASSPAALWRIRMEIHSPVFFHRLIRDDVPGERERQWAAAYINDNFFFPAVEALWKQIGGADSPPMTT